MSKTNLEMLKSVNENGPSTMPKKLKAKWLDALRNGNYVQVRHTLYNEETQGFCCLGVLQHCLTGGVEYDEFGSGRGIPKGVPTFEWLESWGINFNSEECDVFYAGRKNSLAGLNDAGVPFKQIANVIEKQVIGV